VHSTDTHVLIDADVASQYPSIILKLGLTPKALGPSFLVAYRGIYDDRLAAKSRVKEIDREIKELEAQLAAMGESDAE
jgi:hypothetical protein